MKSTTSTLNIYFDGICTHFLNVVPNVPHRVVLPKANAVRLGFFTRPENPEVISYAIMPHLPFLQTTDGGALSSGNAIVDGFIQMPLGMRVMNAVPTGLSYPLNPLGLVVPKLTTFVPGYQMSADVVLEGNAACYLDLFDGTIGTVQSEPSGGIHFEVKIVTDGPPSFALSSLNPLLPLETTLDLPERADATYEVFLSNSDVIDCGSSDFLLHYLTAGGGIPLVLEEVVPGMPPAPSPLEGHVLAVYFTDLADAVRGHLWPYFPVSPTHDSPACSDSQYP